MSEPLNVTDSQFESEVLQSDRPVLVDFWAEWCGPCKMLSPLVDEMAREYSDKLKVAKVNVDENDDVPAQYGVRSIPTLILFKSGQPEATKVGTLTKSQLQQFLDENIS